MNELEPSRVAPRTAPAGAAKDASQVSGVPATHNIPSAVDTHDATALVPSAPTPHAHPLPAPSIVKPVWAGTQDLAGKTIIYGGSFNPPHVGHLLVCKYLLGLGAKEVWMMPAYKHANKGNLASFAARVGMSQLLVGFSEPSIKVTDVEERAPHTGSTYDVMSYIAAEFPAESFAFAMGSDLAASAHTWGNWDKLVQLVPIALVPREGYAAGEATVGSNASSTDVRNRLAQGQSVEGLIPDTVEQFIRENGLYEKR